MARKTKPKVEETEKKVEEIKASTTHPDIVELQDETDNKKEIEKPKQKKFKNVPLKNYQEVDVISMRMPNPTDIYGNSLNKNEVIIGGKK